ncbi:MAG: DUF4783 domain-containing protein [Flavobacteriales bacterium CG18_big_fil_WC_8_21_14_2_50_32_9]|nr:MAG: DUF4783 domain-containing protein [Flavobacteriales bacterium CG18_big_fil_WC_8_21_14_2_50_32_9]PJC61558.1 MAG: DUF4783 domain-containing protein [Flavobacteriales bacterium CG_4_9_14_0_2_um_filter_32_27]
MKKILLGTLVALSLSSLVNPLINDNIAKALKTGNAVTIASFFNATVDLTLPKNEGVFSKAQAEIILKTFFANHKPSDFKVVHDGESKNNTLYSIGNLTTSNGVFRTYILYQEKGTNVVILELRIESEE